VILNQFFMSSLRGGARRAVALGATAALALTGLVASAGPAGAALPLGSATQITTIPARLVSTAGGTSTTAPGPDAGKPGTAAANAAINSGCVPGGFTDQQWYTLPTGSGKLKLSKINHSPYEAPSPTASFAVLDADTLAVVACNVSVVPLDPTKPRLLVAYYAAHDVCLDWEAEVYGCGGQREDYILDVTTGVVPSNDHWQNAKTITSLPYETKVDTTLADDDASNFQLAADCYAAYPSSTVWWKYTPTTSGPVRFQAGSTRGEPVTVHVIPALPAGGPDLSATPLTGPCNGLSEPLTAGSTYYVALVNSNDDSDYYTFTGSQAVLRVGAAPAAMPPDHGVFVSTDSTAKSATLEWQSPGAPGGFKVARDGQDLNGVGPFSTVIPDVYPTNYTFTHLKPWVPYQLSVTSLYVPSLPGYPITRTAFLTAPTPSVPRGVSATVGAPGTNKVKVAWRTPAFVGNGAVTGYRIRKYLVVGGTSVLQQTVSVAASASTYTFTGLAPGSTYRFNATALNGSGAGVTSAKTPAVTP
jgi:hypothetical protein